MASLSYIFDYDDRTVWSPALRVGKLYVVLASEIAEYLDVSSGFCENASDHYRIELEEFKRFVRAMYDLYFSSKHILQRSFLDGILAVSLGMLRRCGVEFAAIGEDQKEFMVRVDKAMKAMPA